MKKNACRALMGAAVGVAGALLATPSLAFRFDMGGVEGAFDSTFTTGFGRRMQDRDCSIVGDPASSCGARANTEQWSAGDNGNLNYDKGDFFTAYLKGTHELLLKAPGGIKFMARGSWLKDFKADDTRRTELSAAAREQVVNDRRLLDLWVSKDFNVAGRDGRARLGNQVVNWGESLFGIGGINATNSLDIQRLLVPGTQIKEAVLPAPMLSVGSALGGGFNVEAYYQFRWNRSRVPPVGSYFSVADYFDRGRESVAFSGANFNVTARDQASRLGRRLYEPEEGDAAINGAGDFAAIVRGDDIKPKHSGQWGASVHYKPPGVDLDVGLYYLRYHDKFPVLNLNASGSEYQWRFLESRTLYGVSANLPVGNWAVGAELSYRPRDAVSLSACYGAGGPLDANTNLALLDNCPQYKDNKKYQAHLTGLLQLTPGDHGAVLDLLGADSGFFAAEAVLVRYPGIGPDKRITRTLEGQEVDQVPAAGYLIFLDRSGEIPLAAGGGTATSWGYVLDFNWTYDGKLIRGWQVTPGATFMHSVRGDTPSFTANYLHGAKAANFYILFNQNPAVWQAGINYTVYFGGKDDPARQFFKDRDFLGAFIARNF